MDIKETNLRQNFKGLKALAIPGCCLVVNPQDFSFGRVPLARSLVQARRSKVPPLSLLSQCLQALTAPMNSFRFLIFCPSRASKWTITITMELKPDNCVGSLRLSSLCDSPCGFLNEHL
ncbi:hypothetical protein RRG08_050013 [Elysia crispata]|nr:hypothetical protein RRG08_050013 [Elysia crispata]